MGCPSGHGHEDAVGSGELTVAGFAPAGDVEAGFESAGVVPARRQRQERRPAGNQELGPPLIAPAGHAVVGEPGACVPPAGGDLGEPAVGRVHLPLVLAAPALQGVVGEHGARERAACRHGLVGAAGRSCLPAGDGAADAHTGAPAGDGAVAAKPADVVVAHRDRHEAEPHRPIDDGDALKCSTSRAGERRNSADGSSRRKLLKRGRQQLGQTAVAGGLGPVDDHDVRRLVFKQQRLCAVSELSVVSELSAVGELSVVSEQDRAAVDGRGKRKRCADVLWPLAVGDDCHVEDVRDVDETGCVDVGRSSQLRCLSRGGSAVGPIEPRRRRARVRGQQCAGDHAVGERRRRAGDHEPLGLMGTQNACSARAQPAVCGVQHRIGAARDHRSGRGANVLRRPRIGQHDDRPLGHPRVPLRRGARGGSRLIKVPCQHQLSRKRRGVHPVIAGDPIDLHIVDRLTHLGFELLRERRCAADQQHSGGPFFADDRGVVGAQAVGRLGEHHGVANPRRHQRRCHRRISRRRAPHDHQHTACRRRTRGLTSCRAGGRTSCRTRCRTNCRTRCRTSCRTRCRTSCRTRCRTSCRTRWPTSC